MSLFHAVVRLDHHTAQIVQFDAAQVQVQQVKEHVHFTRQHGSHVRSGHEFFGEVCDATRGIAELLVVGPRTALADFRHYVEKHRAEMALRIVGWEPADQMSTSELVAMARRHVSVHATMAAPMKAG